MKILDQMLKKIVIWGNGILQEEVETLEESDISDLNEEITPEEIEEAEQLEEKDYIVVNSESMLSKLNSLERDIKTFSTIFPEKYALFLGEIQTLRKEYTESLEEYLKSKKEGLLSFQIDPDYDSNQLVRLSKLSQNIRDFIEGDLKYSLLKERFVKLYYKLNILYNTAIKYCGQKDKQKVLKQLENAKKVLVELIKQAKNSYFFDTEKNKRDQMIEYILYSDYLIFKTTVRCASHPSIETLLKSSLVAQEIKGVRPVDMIGDFLIEDLEGLIEHVTTLQKSLGEMFLNRLEKLQNFDQFSLLSESYWQKVFDIEEEIFKSLLMLTDQEEDSFIPVPKHLQQDNVESIFLDVMQQIKLSLTYIYYQTENTLVEIVFKVISNLKYDITYKEFYLICILFGIYELVIDENFKISTSLVESLKKQAQKHSYEEETILYRKEKVLNLKDKQYVCVFQIENPEEIKETKEALESQNLDYKVKGKKVYLNSFYFDGMCNVMKSYEEKA